MFLWMKDHVTKSFHNSATVCHNNASTSCFLFGTSVHSSSFVTLHFGQITGRFLNFSFGFPFLISISLSNHDEVLRRE